MDRAMTPIQQTRTLCPHLAAATLWATKRTRIRRNGQPRVYHARTLGGPAMDDFLAL